MLLIREIWPAGGSSVATLRSFPRLLPYAQKCYHDVGILPLRRVEDLACRELRGYSLLWRNLHIRTRFYRCRPRQAGQLRHRGRQVRLFLLYPEQHGNRVSSREFFILTTTIDSSASGAQAVWWAALLRSEEY